MEVLIQVNNMAMSGYGIGLRSESQLYEIAQRIASNTPPDERTPVKSIIAHTFKRMDPENLERLQKYGPVTA